ncbi:hypothetical protein H6G93_32300 [Nostoc sp. FACHB-973]|uniref:Uncharacterized protein n=1 Tax=Desmonostoc muscorum LEGE 12446 TaxID=1828758 RepID=A0A8J7AD01_DESMC|nr:hypothetical protein [Desmonostoc muscorum]MBD2519562.1 hypothetical protein [Nostoc sp. FACHB-973]MBX9256880.1 hypothetical protein [Desmonostoc muscorum CCALA 125]MCF2149174.1 hypothetical protein [Desmonostoc muscorum LEGE 12446]
MLAVPMLAIVGSEDIRPSWPVEQVANLMPCAYFQQEQVDVFAVDFDDLQCELNRA